MQVFRRVLRHLNGQAFCTTEYVPAEHWLRTTWQGFVSPTDAEQGALAALEPLQLAAAPCLLNDNSQLKGPWFNSADWLQRVWVPQAARLGLRYVAHVAQPHTEADLDAVLARDPFGQQLEVQVFSSPEDAEAWLRERRQHHAPPPAQPVS